MIPRTAARTLLVTAGVALLALPGPAARAADPMDLSEQVVDEAGVLGDRADDVRDAVDELASETGIDLYVVYVDDFGGSTYTEWGVETGELSGFGGQDTLLAVAVDARQFFFDSYSPRVQEWVPSVNQDVQGALGADDWAGAAIAAAEGLQANASGGAAAPAPAPGQGTGTPSEPAGSGGGAGGFLTLLLVGAVVIGGVLLVRSLRKKDRPRGAAAPQPGGPAPTGLEALPTDELDKRAASALVRVDDAIKTSEQELGFAQAQFGLEATREFAALLEEGKAKVLEAFHLRQVLDDHVPDPEPVVRDHSLRILHLCREVAESLDAQTARFDELRDLHNRAPELLDADEARAAEVERRIAPARATLDRLAATYPAEALASVRDNPAQVEALVAQVRETVAQGREALEAGDRGAAVDLARASENALGQAVTLLDAVDRAGDVLATAGQRLDRAIASISSDVDDARRLAPESADVAPRVDAARAAIEDARAARSGGDPLAALRTITDAEAELDRALEPYREREEQDRRAEALLRETLGRVDSVVRATADFVTTRRGAVGPDARTRLAEAERLLRTAHQQGRDDPRGALEIAQRAEQLAREAQAIAQDDVDRHDRDRWGGPGGGYRSGPDLGGMILGGILIDSILRGGRGGGWGGGGGGWGGGGGGGGFGGGFGGGGFGGGGFGGGGGGGSF